MLNYQRVYIYNTGWWFQPLKKISQLGLYPSDQIAISPWSLLQGDGQHHQGTNSEGAPQERHGHSLRSQQVFNEWGLSSNRHLGIYGNHGKIPKKYGGILWKTLWSLAVFFMGTASINGDDPSGKKTGGWKMWPHELWPVFSLETHMV